MIDPHHLQHLENTLHKKNLLLDGLAMVWCSGGCEGGLFRFSDEKLTLEMLDLVKNNTKRLECWYWNEKQKRHNEYCRNNNLTCSLALTREELLKRYPD